ncbi:sensor histidine kinase [Saccharopolyspora erythraea]|nr:sensor histidine kinase [Saccharopolyspora erythraea]
MREWAASLPRVAAGLLIGALTASAEFGYVLCATVLRPVLRLWRRSRHRGPAVLDALALRLVEVERWRLLRFSATATGSETDPPRAVEYLVMRSLVGMLGGFVLALVLYGFVGSPVILVELWTHDFSTRGKLLRTAWLVVFGTVMLFLGLAGLWGVAAIDRAVAQHFLGSDREELLRRRVAELATSRADVVAEIDAERRRIERDLHDGVQQRMVALGMLIGRARRAGDGPRAAELLRQAHEESQQVLHDLREVSWRVYPSALDAEGLHAALETVAARAAVPVELRYRLHLRPPAAVEAAAYFVVSESVTNAAKHSGAATVVVELEREDGGIVVRVTDDGMGGALPDGAGLSGLARRVAGLDGRFAVRSPSGGPTTITAELPCA